MLQRLALYATLGLVLDAVGQGVTTAGFWCIVALFWAVEHLTRIDTIAEIEAEVARLKKERQDNK